MLFRQFLQSWEPVLGEDEDGYPEMNKEAHGGVRAKDWESASAEAASGR
jgi:hypothetical protein